jgi:hypothetical protein
MRTQLVMDTLEMAVTLREPDGLCSPTLTRHPVTSICHTERLDQLGIAPSVGPRTDAHDKAMAEAFIGTFEADGRRPALRKLRCRSTRR